MLIDKVSSENSYGVFDYGQTFTQDKTVIGVTDREIEVLSLIVQGFINKEIADHLCISVNTVTTHRRNIARKLSIHSSAGITIYAIVNKLVTLDEVNV